MSPITDRSQASPAPGAGRPRSPLGGRRRLPRDVYSLLRAHAEARWLSHEMVPVLRELEQRESLPEQRHASALAYLEVLTIEAGERAAETDAAYAELDAAAGDLALREKARRYHAALRRLRAAVARRSAPLLAARDDPSTRPSPSFSSDWAAALLSGK